MAWVWIGLVRLVERPVKDRLLEHMGQVYSGVSGNVRARGGIIGLAIQIGSDEELMKVGRMAEHD